MVDFLNYDYLESDLHFKKVKSQNALWNLQSCHINNHRKSNFFQSKVLPVNNVADVRNSFLDFKVEDVAEFINKSYILNMKITNNNSSNAVTISSLLFNIDHIELLHQGVSKWNSANCFESVFRNNLFLDCKQTLNGNLLSNQGISASTGDVSALYSLAASTSVTWRGELCLPISNTNFYRPKLKGELIIRVYFKSYFDTGSHDSDVVISNVFLYVNSIKISAECAKKFMLDPILHYPYNAFLYRQYSLNNGITSGVEFSQQLTSYQYHTSTFFIWISKANDTKANFFKNYEISSLRLTNANNENILNNMVLDSKLLTYLNSKYHFDDSGSSFFSNNVNVYCVTVSVDLYEDIVNQGYNGSLKVKLYITTNATEANQCKLNILFVSPSIIEVSANEMNLIYSAF